MSSIADKFKKFLPAGGDSGTVRVDSTSTLALDSGETLQPPEEQTVRIRRDSVPEATPDAVLAMDAADDQAPAGSSMNRRQAEEQGAPPPGPACAVRSLRSNPARQQRVLAIVLAGRGRCCCCSVAGSAILRAERLAQQVAATGQSLMQSQRLAKSVSQALVGSVPAFAEVKDSSDD